MQQTIGLGHCQRKQSLRLKPKMKTTITHCGQQAKPYAKLYGKKGRPHSIESGFRCDVCGQHRVPFGLEVPDRAEEYEKLRMEGIAFDESLNNKQ